MEIGDAGAITSNYNQFFKGATIYDVKRNGSYYQNIGNWQPVASQDANSADGDPLFTTAGSVFTLQSGSPCKNTGVVISTIPQYDILGNPIVGSVDMGCYEHQ